MGEYIIRTVSFEITECSAREKTVDEMTAFVDLSKEQNITLRTRRDGDIIYPLGLGGKMKLKKYLINKKIPQHKRDKLILLCSGNEVLWVAGIGMSHKIKVTQKPTHKLTIKYNED